MIDQTDHRDPPATLLDIISPYLTKPGPGPLRADADLVKLGLDSLGVVSILTDVEDAFGVEFPDETLNMTTLETPSALWSVVVGLLDCAKRDSK